MRSVILMHDSTCSQKIVLGRLNITKTLASLSKTGRPPTDQDMLKWANATAQKGKAGVRPIRSFKDPSITTGLFFLDLLDAIRPGIVDPSLVIPVADSGPYEDRRQNGACYSCGVDDRTYLCLLAQLNSLFQLQEK